MKRREVVIEHDELTVFTQRTCWFDPQEDITAYELAQCHPILSRLEHISSALNDRREWLWNQIEETPLTCHFVFAKIKMFKMESIPDTNMIRRTEEYYWDLE